MEEDLGAKVPLRSRSGYGKSAMTLSLIVRTLLSVISLLTPTVCCAKNTPTLVLVHGIVLYYLQDFNQTMNHYFFLITNSCLHYLAILVHATGW
ncbi:hypothetical protein ACFX1Z_037906 [Malus domestica]